MQLVSDARDQSTRMQVSDLLAEVEKESAAFAADAGLLSTLAEIREAMDEVPPAHSDAAYAAAFRSAGLEPEHGSPEQTALAVAQRPARVALGIAVALDSWAGLRRDRTARGLAAIDNRRGSRPRPLARRLRTALIEPRRELRLAALCDLARSAPGGDLPSVSLMLLGEALLCAGDPTTAEALLRTAHRGHPNDVWLAPLGQALEKLDAAPGGRPVLHDGPGLASWLVHALAHALDLEGETDEAIAVFRDLVRLARPTPGTSFVSGRCSAHTDATARPTSRSIRPSPPVARRSGANPTTPCFTHSWESPSANGAAWMSPSPSFMRRSVSNRPTASHISTSAGRTIIKVVWTTPLPSSARRSAWSPTTTGHTSAWELPCDRGRLDEAVTELRGAIRLQPDHAAAHFSFGVALFRQARVDLALDEFRETIRLQPDHAAAHSEVVRSCAISSRTMTRRSPSSARRSGSNRMTRSPITAWATLSLIVTIRRTHSSNTGKCSG